MGEVANLRCHLVMSRNVSGGTVCTYGVLKLIASWHAGRKLGWGKEKCRQRELTARERGGMRGARANGWDLRNTEGRVCRLPSLTRLMASRRQHVRSVFAPRALVPLRFYALFFLSFFFSFFYSSAALTMWSNTPTKPHSHTQKQHTHTHTHNSVSKG